MFPLHTAVVGMPMYEIVERWMEIQYGRLHERRYVRYGLTGERRSGY